MDDTVEFVSSADAEVHQKNGMGTYIKTSQMAQGFPVFEQAKIDEDGLQYFLFVDPYGRWGVGPDITTKDGSVLKHLKTKPTPHLPPKTGWYYCDEVDEDNHYWIEDDAIEAIVNVNESSWKQQDLPYLPYYIITLNHGKPVNDVAISNNNQYIYTGGLEGYIRFWDLNQLASSISPASRKYFTPVTQLDLGASGVYGPNAPWSQIMSMKLMPHGSSSCLVVGGSALMGRSIHIIDLGGPCPTFKSQMGSSTRNCFGLAISPDGRLCYSCQLIDYPEETSVDVWDIHNETLVGQLRGDTDSISCIDISADGTKLWTGGEDKTVRMWDPRAFRQVQQHELDDKIMDLACCPTDDWVVVGTEKSYVDVLHGSKPDKHKVELNAGVECMRLRNEGSNFLKFANSGKWFMSTGFETIGCIAPSGPKIFELEAKASCCTISSDDSYMILGSQDGKKDTAEVFRVEY